jgi:hypothetical protein
LSDRIFFTTLGNAAGKRPTMQELDDPFVNHDSQLRAAEFGARPALIEQFGIRGLYGYRTISLSSHHAATFLIAKNGMGKTTLLGALDAFLKLELYRLRKLEFHEIFCKLRGVEEELILTHDDVVTFLQVPTDGEFAKIVSRTGIDSQKLFKFITTDYAAALDNWLNDLDPSSVLNLFVRAFNNSIPLARKAGSDVLAALFARTPELSKLRDSINLALDDREIVYLPTYRRVELSLTDEGED